MAGSSSNIRAGRAYVELGLQGDIESGLKRADARLRAFGTAVVGIGLSMVAAGASVIGVLSSAAVAFGVMGQAAEVAALKSGLTVEQLTALQYAAQQTGVDVESLETGLRKMQKTVGEAAEGSKSAQQELQKLGLTVADLRGLTPDQQFEKISQSLSQIQSPAERAASAMEIFGRGGADLLPLMNQGAAGIQTLMKQADNLGLVMSGQDASAATKFNDVLKTLYDQFKVLTFQVGAAIAEYLQPFAEAAVNITAEIIAWTKSHRDLAVTILQVAAGVVVAGTAIAALGIAIVGVGAVVGAAASIVGTFTGAISLLAAGIGTVLFSSVGVGIVAVGALAASFVNWRGIAVEVVKNVIGAFGQVWDSIKTVFSNTSSASEAMAAIMKESSSYAEEAWAAAKGFIVNLWISLKGEASQVWNEVSTLIVQSAYDASEEFMKIWSQTMHGWNAIVNATANFIETRLFQTQQKQLDAALKQIDALQAAGRITPQQAEQQRTAAHKTFDTYDQQQNDQATSANDAALNESLAKIKSEYDAKRAYLDDLTAKQASAALKATADEKKANDIAVANAKAVAEAKRKAYEDALKAAHDKSGEQSLVAQFKELSRSAGGFDDLLKQPQDAADELDSVRSQNTSRGTFNASALQSLQGGSTTAAEQTAQNTKTANDHLAAIIAKLDRKPSGIRSATAAPAAAAVALAAASTSNPLLSGPHSVSNYRATETTGSIKTELERLATVLKSSAIFGEVRKTASLGASQIQDHLKQLSDIGSHKTPPVKPTADKNAGNDRMTRLQEQTNRLLQGIGEKISTATFS